MLDASVPIGVHFRGARPPLVLLCYNTWLLSGNSHLSGVLNRTGSAYNRNHIVCRLRVHGTDVLVVSTAASHKRENQTYKAAVDRPTVQLLFLEFPYRCDQQQ